MRSRDGVLALAALLLMVAIVIVPGFFDLPPVDRDEARFAQASHQILQSGDWIDLRIQESPRYEKPVGIYWLQALTVRALDAPGQIWAYRAVSAAAALIAVALTVAIAGLMLPRRGALLAGAMLGTSLLLGGEAHLAKTDAALLAASLAGLWVLARLQMRGTASRSEAALFWIAMAAAVLIKGPLGPMLAGFVALGIAVQRRSVAVLRDLRPLWGVPLFLALAAPWFIAITLVSDGAFWARSLGRDMAGKIAEGVESHGAPPGTYLAAFWLTFWPGSALAVAALAARGTQLWRGGRAFLASPQGAFLMAWILPWWGIFEAVPTKLLHYTLPTYPALAILIAIGLEGAQPRRAALWLAGAVGLAVPLFLALALWSGAARIGLSPGWTLPAGLALAGAGMAGVIGALAAGTRRGLIPALGVAGLGMATMVFATLATMPGLWPSVRIAQAWQALRTGSPGCAGAPLYVAGYSEPSLIFLTEGAVRLVSLEEAARALATPGCKLVAMPVDAASGAALPAPDMRPDMRVEGFSLGAGRRVALSLHRRAP